VFESSLPASGCSRLVAWFRVREGERWGKGERGCVDWRTQCSELFCRIESPSSGAKPRLGSVVSAVSPSFRFGASRGALAVRGGGVSSSVGGSRPENSPNLLRAVGVLR
jgi:hypothetical protein